MKLTGLPLRVIDICASSTVLSKRMVALELQALGLNGLKVGCEVMKLTIWLEVAVGVVALQHSQTPYKSVPPEGLTVAPDSFTNPTTLLAPVKLICVSRVKLLSTPLTCQQIASSSILYRCASTAKGSSTKNSGMNNFMVLLFGCYSYSTTACVYNRDSRYFL